MRPTVMKVSCLSRFALLLATLAGGCGASESSPQITCRPVCEKTCQAFADCDVGAAEAPSCVDACIAGSAPSTCASARPADQLTCDELRQIHACAQYCATLCHRAPSCGTFDENLCNTGCADYGPPVCNAGSVAARTCDQLKPELRAYEDRGSALAQPGGFSGGGVSSPAAFGLCRDASDCAAALGCSTSTNTCTPCTANADCARMFGKYVCSSAAQCVAAECLTSADCSGGAPACNPSTFRCVGCLLDADCASALLPSLRKCDMTVDTCVECLTNADCPVGTPTCEPTGHFCLP